MMVHGKITCLISLKVTPKLTEDLKKPFKLEGGVQRIDDTPVHKAVR